MEPTSFFHNQVTLNCNSPTHEKLQQKLRDAIRKQNLANVRSILNFVKPSFDLNCIDFSGKTLLQVAGDLKDASIRNDIIQALLSEGADLQMALLHAVRDENAKIVQILLQFQKQNTQESRDTLHSLKSRGYTTPLILAAWMQNFQIVKLLLDQGFTISDPNNPQWYDVSNGMVCDKLGPSMYRLNRYRALASPVYISACFLQDEESGPDPFNGACVLNKELREIAEQEYEFRKEYLELSDGCMEFAVALLNECNSMEEIKTVLEAKIEDGGLCNMGTFNILEFAVITRNETLVSHPYSQLILNSVIYKGASFLEKSPWKQALLILLASVLSPVMFMVWLVFDVCFPSHMVARMFHSPRVKFLTHCGSYQTFLFLLAVSSPKSDFLRYSNTDWLVVSFVIGLLVDVVRNFYQQGRVRFFSNRCNWMAVAIVAFFICHYIIWWAGRATMPDNLRSLEEFAKHKSYKVMLSSECFLAVGILLAFVHNFSYIQGNSSTGPLLHAFVEMVIDVSKFFLYFIFIFMAFAVSFTKLYLQYRIAKTHFNLNQEPGTNDADYLELERLEISMAAMFWSLFGDLSRENFKIKEESYDELSITGLVLFAVYKVVAVLVALNMLIAIVNESYTRISAKLDTEWKFTRTKLWLGWIYKKDVLPPPYNVLYVLLPVCWVLKRLASACCPEIVRQCFKKFRKDKPRKIWKVQEIHKKKRREVIRSLILRYLAQKRCHAEMGPDDSDEENDKETAALHTINGLDTTQTTV